MNFKTGLAVAAVVIGLGATSMAMDHGRDRDDRGQFRRAAWHDDHDRDKKGWEEGKKKGWHGEGVPPGQARKESKEWRHEHERESLEHRREMERRRHEAREHRHASHEVVAHKQTKPPTNTHRSAMYERLRESQEAKKEHKQEAQHK